MGDVSAETGRIVQVGFKKMFFPANVKAKEIVSRPEFGGVSCITGRYPECLPAPEERNDMRKMVGFLDHIMHPYSVLIYLAGRVESIYVERNRKTGASVTAIRFESGAVGSLHLPHAQSGMSPLERTEVVGDGANVIVDNNVRVIYHRPGRPEGGYGRASTVFGPDDGGTLFWEPEFSLGQLYNSGLFLLGYAQELIAFCECALTGRAPEVAGLDDALELAKIYEAYPDAHGRVVTIPRG